MSYSSYSRVRAGIEEPTHTISARVVSQTIDLRGMKRGSSGGIAVPMARGAAPLSNLGADTAAIIAAAKGPRKQGQQAKRQQQANDAEAARQQHQQATLDSYTQAAEDQAAQGSQRHGVYLTDSDQVATSSADTRGANGPLGLFAEPAVVPTPFVGGGLGWPGAV
jgi:hypothetical protein